MKEQIKTVSMTDEVEFEKIVNALLAEGWKVSTTSAGFIDSENYNYTSLYHAILVRTIAIENGPDSLLPCPFCGCTANIEDSGDGVVWVKCANNSRWAEQRTSEVVDKAIANWNRRCK